MVLIFATILAELAALADYCAVRTADCQREWAVAKGWSRLVKRAFHESIQKLQRDHHHRFQPGWDPESLQSELLRSRRAARKQRRSMQVWGYLEGLFHILAEESSMRGMGSRLYNWGRDFSNELREFYDVNVEGSDLSDVHPRDLVARDRRDLAQVEDRWRQQGFLPARVFRER